MTKSLEDMVTRYTAHNDRAEAKLIAEGDLVRRPSMPPLAINLEGQLKSIIAATERRLPQMSLDAQGEVRVILSQLKALQP